MTLDHLSYSSITSYLDCAESWRRKYIAKEPTKSNAALVFGSAFHGAIETFLRDGDRLGEPASYFPAAWEAALAKDTVDWGLDTPESHCNEGIRLLNDPGIANAVKAIEVGRDEEGWKIERKVILFVPGVPIPIIGYIDLIAANGVPVDLKTAKARWPDGKAQDSLQSLFYLAALNQAGVTTHDWRFRHMIFVKTKTPQIQVLEHLHKPAELFFLFKLVRSVWEGIRADIFPLNPTGWKCGPLYCDFWENCRGKYI